MATEALIVFWVLMIISAFILRVSSNKKKAKQRKIEEELEQLKKELKEKNKSKD